MKHFHGTPLGGTRDSVARFIAAGNRHFLVPHARDEDMPVVSEVSTGFCLDNSAYTAWKQGKPITNWQPYYDWVKLWCRNPRFEFAIVPDVIDGSEEDNDKLYGEWFRRTKIEGGWVEGAPVWHMHETLGRLESLMQHCRIICVGSSGIWETPGTEAWHERMREAMAILCDKDGHPRRKIHGLRMLRPDIVERYPFYSADSTNVAQNSQLMPRFGMYPPSTQSQRREVIASRIESARSPSAYSPPAKQTTLLF